MTRDEILHTKINFWVTWVIANSIGLGLGLSAGELLGRLAIGSTGWRAGQAVGILVCEGFVWLARGTVLGRFRMQEVFKLIDAVMWISTELLVWIAIDLQTGPQSLDNGSLLGITSGSLFGFWLGAMFWIVFWFMRMPKPRSKDWFAKAFISAFIGFLIATGVIAMVFTAGLMAGEAIARSMGFVYGVAVAGLVTGLLVGSITGLTMTQWMKWPNPVI